MTIWEYKVISEPTNLGIGTLQGHLEQLGADGWELAGILGLVFIFKRPKNMVMT